MTLTCDRLEADLDAAGEVAKLTALGHVVVIDGDREAHSDRAEFDNSTGVLVATGHPWGRQRHRDVEGEVVTFTAGLETLVITKPHTRAVEEKTGTVVIDADTLEQHKSTAVWKGHVKACAAPPPSPRPSSTPPGTTPAP